MVGTGGTMKKYWILALLLVLPGISCNGTKGEGAGDAGKDAGTDAGQADGGDGDVDGDVDTDVDADADGDSDMDSDADAGKDAASDAAQTDYCDDKINGLWCDGNDLVSCVDHDEDSRTACGYGCEDSVPLSDPYCNDWCFAFIDGKHCDGNDLVLCLYQREAYRVTCPTACIPGGLFTPSKCEAVSFCTDLPDASPDPPSVGCPVDQYHVEALKSMDWKLSPDGFYLVTRFFGTTQDPDADAGVTGLTDCGNLQGYYSGHGCRYDAHSGCLDNNTIIDHIQGMIDFDYNQVIVSTWGNMDGNEPHPEYFYVSSAQRFNCGAVLRVTNTEIGRCVVVYAEQGGPAGAAAVGEMSLGRRRLDVSPAVAQYLLMGEDYNTSFDHNYLVYVEWGLASDIPGHACTPCESLSAEQGTEASRTPWDLNHMVTSENCRP